MSIGEIIARHQQQQRAQDALVRNYIGPRADAAALPADGHRPGLRRRDREPLLRRRRRRRVGRAVVLGQRLEVGRRPAAVSAAAAGEGAVAAAPAAVRRGLSLSPGGDRDRRRLDCYVVRFEPVRETRRSTAARSGSTGRRSRACACRRPRAGSPRRWCRTRKRSTTAAPSVGNQPVFLFSGLSARQILLIAGRNLLLEKEVTFSDFRVNDAEFERERASARESDRIMYRETDRGLRYYVKEGRRAGRQRPRHESREGDGDGRHARSVVRVSAADLRDQLPGLQFRLTQSAAGDSVCRRPRGRQHPAIEDREHASRRQRRLLRDCRAVERPPLRGRTAKRRPSAC